MVMKPTEERPRSGDGAGVVGDEGESQPCSPGVERAVPADDGASRAAKAIAYVGGVLVLLGSLALALIWMTDLWAAATLLGIVGTVALASSRATLRVRPSAVSNILAGVAAIALSLGIDVALDASGMVFGRVERWLLFCAPILLFGSAFGWWLGSRVAGSWAVFGWVLLPLALATGSEERLGVALPLLDPLSEISVWAALALMVVAVTLVGEAGRLAAQRGRIAPSTANSITFVASSTLGVALVIAAAVQDTSWFYFVLIAGAFAATGIAVWRRDWVWLPMSTRLLSTCGVTALGGIGSGPGRAMALVILAYSFFTFTPFRQRLPDRLSVRIWEGMIWLMGFGVSCAFAGASAGWPAAGALWAAAMILLGAAQRRVLAMVLSSLALFVVFIIRVIDLFGATAGAGFGTMSFGVTMLVFVVVWRQRSNSVQSSRRS